MNVREKAPEDVAARLRRLERQLRSTLELLPGLVFDWHIPTDCVERFGAVEKLIGVASEDIDPGRGGWIARIHPDDLDRFWGAVSPALEKRGSFQLEYRVRRADGSYADLWERGFVETGDDGKPLRVFGVAVDVSERRRMEAALADSETRFRAFLDAEPQCVKVLDPEGRLLHMNPAGLAMIEADSPALVLGRMIEDVLLPEHRPAFRRQHRRALRGETGSIEFEIEGLKGRRLWMGSAVAPLRDADGEIVGSIAVTSDITEKRRHDERLRVQAEILETMAEGVVLTDHDARIRYTNRAFGAMFGYRGGELAGREVWSLAASPRWLATRLRQLEREGRGERMEFDATRRDGSVFRATLAHSRLAIGGRRHWIGVLQDVSERKLLEQELLEISGREQARIGHDLHDGLGQDLTAIALFLQGLRDRLEREAPEAVSELEAIKGLVNRAINSTRRLARGMSPIVLDDRGLPGALRDLGQESSERYGLPVRVRVRGGSGADLGAPVALQLYRIAQEAITNVARHAKAQRVSVNLDIGPRRVTLSVLDDGVGLPEDQPPPGMGLRIMRYRADVIGGEFSVSSRAGGGTTVQVSCPRPVERRLRRRESA